MEPSLPLEYPSDNPVPDCCHPRFNNLAVVGHDAATGHGLLNTAGAVEYAMEEF